MPEEVVKLCFCEIQLHVNEKTALQELRPLMSLSRCGSFQEMFLRQCCKFRIEIENKFHFPFKEGGEKDFF